MKKIRVLFVCVHNSARSQMAEAYLKKFSPERFEADSAGIEKGNLNPLVVKAMAEEGIDISNNQTKSVMDLIKKGLQFDFIITVCDEINGERCPIFPGRNVRIHWSYLDPSALEGTEEEKMVKIREIRDLIKNRVKVFTEEILSV